MVLRLGIALLALGLARLLLRDRRLALRLAPRSRGLRRRLSIIRFALAPSKQLHPHRRARLRVRPPQRRDGARHGRRRAGRSRRRPRQRGRDEKLHTSMDPDATLRAEIPSLISSRRGTSPRGRRHIHVQPHQGHEAKSGAVAVARTIGARAGAAAPPLLRTRAAAPPPRRTRPAAGRVGRHAPARLRCAGHKGGRVRAGRARRGERLPAKPQPRDHARARLPGLARERELVSRARDEIRVVLAQLVVAIARSSRARVASRVAEPGPAWLGAAARLRSGRSGATPLPALECMINIHQAHHQHHASRSRSPAASSRPSKSYAILIERQSSAGRGLSRVRLRTGACETARLRRAAAKNRRSPDAAARTLRRYRSRRTDRTWLVSRLGG